MNTRPIMTKNELYNFYLEYCVNTENELPLSYIQWEIEIYPQDLEFLRIGKIWFIFIKLLDYGYLVYLFMFWAKISLV